MSKIQKPQEQWQAELDPTTFAVTRCSATEPAFSGKYWDHHADGVYRCACCAAALFDSQTKFDSGSGWPSYYQPIQEETIAREADLSHGMRRVEVKCADCGAHLGHVFEDGPNPTGLRYCINSAALDFEQRDKS